MTQSKQILKKIVITASSLLLSSAPITCGASEQNSGDIVYYGENLITVSLANALNSQLSNAGDVTHVNHMKEEINTLNVLISEKSEQITSLRNNLSEFLKKNEQITIKKNSSSKDKSVDKIIASDINHRLTQIISEKKSLLQKINDLKTQRENLQSRLELTKREGDDQISDLKEKNKLILDDSKSVNAAYLKLNNNHKMLASDVSSNIKTLNTLLSITNEPTNIDTNSAFVRVISDVKKILSEKPTKVDLAKIATMKQEISTLNALVLKKDAKVASIEHHLKLLAKEKSEKTAMGEDLSNKQISLLNKTVKELHLQLSKVLSDKGEMMGMIDDMKNRHNHLQSIFNSTKELDNKTISNLKSRNSELSKDIKIKSGDYSKLNTSHHELSSTIERNVKDLQSILSIHPTHQKNSLNHELANIADNVRQVVVKQKHPVISADNYDALSNIKSRTRELSKRLKKSLITGSFVEQLYYITSNAKLTKPQQEYIDQLFKLTSKYKNVEVFITGRADPRGSISYNQHLAKERANIVANIAKKEGILTSDIHVSSHVTNSEIKENSELHFFDRNTTVVIKRK